MSQQISTGAITSAAPLEPNISTEHEYTDSISRTLTGTTWSGPIKELVSSTLTNCGRYDLVKLEVAFHAAKEDMTIRAGVCNVDSGCSIIQGSMKENGICQTSNITTKGITDRRTIIPEDTLSRQLAPVSSHLPTPKFMIEFTAGMTVVVTIFVKVHGIRMHYLNLASN